MKAVIGVPQVWLGLLAAPAAVLVAQSANYALVQVFCATHRGVWLDLVSGGAFLFSVASSWAAWRRWRRVAQPFDASYVPRDARSAFLALMAMVVAALCAVIQLTFWFPQWLLSPCL